MKRLIGMNVINVERSTECEHAQILTVVNARGVISKIKIRALDHNFNGNCELRVTEVNEEV